MRWAALYLAAPRAALVKALTSAIAGRAVAGRAFAGRAVVARRAVCARAGEVEALHSARSGNRLIRGGRMSSSLQGVCRTSSSAGVLSLAGVWGKRVK